MRVSATVVVSEGEVGNWLVAVLGVGVKSMGSLWRTPLMRKMPMTISSFVPTVKV